MAVLHQAARGPLPKIAPLLIAALERTGWTVTTTYWGGRNASEGWVRKVASRSADLVAALWRLGRRPQAVLFVNSAHSRRGVARDVPLLIGARLLRRGTVVLWHGSGPQAVARHPWSPFAVASRAVARLADAVLLLSDDESARWQSLVPQGRFIQVTNPYEAAMPAGPRGGGEAVVFLFVGRLMRDKGVYELLEAFQSLAGTGRCRLAMVGDGPEREAVVARVASLGMNASVDLPGYLEGSALVDRYLEADVFVLPSYSEGFPTVVAEAMDAGLPIVTTPCGGMVDHLSEGVNCLFVRPGDSQGLGEALRTLVDDAVLRRSMGAANRSAVGNFAPDVVVGPYVKALEQARARSRGGRRGHSRGGRRG